MNNAKLHKRRYYYDLLLKYLGKISISLICTFLVYMFLALVYEGSGTFTNYHIAVEKPKNDKMDKEQVIQLLNEMVYPAKNYLKFFSIDAVDEIANSSSAKVEALASSALKSYFQNGKKSKNFNEEEKMIIEKFENNGLISKNHDLSFFYNKESREAELAGIYTSFAGTIYTILICMIFAIPLAVCSAIYLEEYAPKNFFTSLIEINLSNLASIPSIVYGLLGLSVLINLFGAPRSAPITAGITLGIMIFPILVITSRQAIKSVPKTIKHAALALGATKAQVIFHHVLPLSLPGIATGVILGVARAIGETAPLILIGMVAFIVDPPRSIFDPSTVLPVQIYLWSSSPEEGFQEKTSAAIVFLLVLLFIFNSFAIYLRKKYEKKW